MQFNFPKLAWSAEIFDRLLKAIKDSVEKHDWDSGWVATPTNKVLSHPLGLYPVEVFVYASDSQTGDAFSSDTFTSVTTSQITITGPKAYCRVLMNK